MNYPITYQGKRVQLLPSKAITAALTNDVSGKGGALGVTGLNGMQYLAIQARFIGGTGGTSAKAYVQTSFDKGVTWVDIASFAFANASLTKLSAVNVDIAPGAQAASGVDGALADNTVLQGLLGDRLRVKITTVGAYTGTTLAIDCWVK